MSSAAMCLTLDQPRSKLLSIPLRRVRVYTIWKQEESVFEDNSTEPVGVDEKEVPRSPR